MTRRGMSLIELLVIMSAASVVLSTSAVIIHRTMRAQELTRYFFENERAAQRLARQFRRDVHDAASLDAAEGAVTNVDPDAAQDVEPFLSVELAGVENDDLNSKIEYRRTPTGVLRTVTRDGEPAAREEYAVASIARLELREEDSPRRLALTITADPVDFIPKLGKTAPTIRDTPVNLQVVAVISRDSRFAPAISKDDDAEDDAQ